MSVQRKASDEETLLKTPQSVYPTSSGDTCSSSSEEEDNLPVDVEEQTMKKQRSWKNTIKRAVKNNWKALFWMVGAILAMVGQTIYLKQSANKMPIFPYFIFWFTVLPFVLAFFVFYWICRLLGTVTKEQRQVPQYIYFIIGTLTTINGVFMLFSNPHVPGVMQALLGPSVVTIPMSMAISLIVIRKCYAWQQFVAVLVIMGGLVIAMYPSISGHNSSNTGPIVWNIIFFLGSVPATLAAVYEERVLHKRPVHIAHLLAWSTLYQAATIFLSFPTDIIPHFGTADGIKDFGNNQWAALRCAFGQDIPDACPQCDCGSAWLPLWLFVATYLLSSLTQLGVIQYGNATLYYVVSTLSLPLSEFAFASPIMGSDREHLSMFNYIALVVLLVGVVLYRIFDRSGKSKDTLEELDSEEEDYMTDLKHPYSSYFSTQGDMEQRKVRSLGVTAFPSYSGGAVATVYAKTVKVPTDEEEEDEEVGPEETTALHRTFRSKPAAARRRRKTRRRAEKSKQDFWTI